MVSNYALAYEIDTAAEYAMKDVHVIVIDRWYASTCAYTIARPPVIHHGDGDRSTSTDVCQKMFTIGHKICNSNHTYYLFYKLIQRYDKNEWSIVPAVEKEHLDSILGMIDWPMNHN